MSTSTVCFIRLDWVVDMAMTNMRGLKRPATPIYWWPLKSFTCFFLRWTWFCWCVILVELYWRQVASSKRCFVIFSTGQSITHAAPIFQWFFSGGWNGKVSSRRFPWGWNRWITLNPELRRPSEMSIVGLCLWNIEKGHVDAFCGKFVNLFRVCRIGQYPSQ